MSKEPSQDPVNSLIRQLVAHFKAVGEFQPMMAPDSVGPVLRDVQEEEESSLNPLDEDSELDLASDDELEDEDDDADADLELDADCYEPDDADVRDESTHTSSVKDVLAEAAGSKSDTHELVLRILRMVEVMGASAVRRRQAGSASSSLPTADGSESGSEEAGSVQGPRLDDPSVSANADSKADPLQTQAETSEGAASTLEMSALNEPFGQDSEEKPGRGSVGTAGEEDSEDRGNSEASREEKFDPVPMFMRFLDALLASMPKMDPTLALAESLVKDAVPVSEIDLNEPVSRATLQRAQAEEQASDKAAAMAIQQDDAILPMKLFEGMVRVHNLLGQATPKGAIARATVKVAECLQKQDMVGLHFATMELQSLAKALSGVREHVDERTVEQRESATRDLPIPIVLKVELVEA